VCGRGAAHPGGGGGPTMPAVAELACL
jgi:hypothetical protein